MCLIYAVRWIYGKTKGGASGGSDPAATGDHRRHLPKAKCQDERFVPRVWSVNQDNSTGYRQSVAYISAHYQSEPL